MEYIDAEEFLKQPEEVQKVLKDWFNENINPFCLVHYPPKRIFNAGQIPSKYIDCMNPLFTEGQLRKFIEDKSSGKVFLTYGRDKTYTIFIGYGSKGVFHTEILLDSNESDLLQAYWEVACKIAEKEIEKEGK